MTKVVNETYLMKLCSFVKDKVMNEKYDDCVKPITDAMINYPHAPEPHNLLGIILEKKGDHQNAMKHFRAAIAMEPTYHPANHNLLVYGTFFSDGYIAFDERDLPEEKENNVEIVYNEYGVGRVVSKNQVVYDKNGVGRIVRRA